MLEKHFGDAKSADVLYRRALDAGDADLAGTRAKLLVCRGADRHARGDAEGALSACLLALAANPEEGDALCRTADLLRRKGDADGARGMYERAHDLRVITAEALVGWGAMLEVRGTCSTPSPWVRGG